MIDHNKHLAVIKVGGDMLLDEADKHGLALNIKALHDHGWHCIVVHGGGPQVNALQKLHGLIPNKIAGRRITGLDDLRVVKQALCGEVNVDLVSCLLAQGLSALGLHGASGNLIQATKRPPIHVSGEENRLIDFGEVGDIIDINKTLLQDLLNAQQIPVIASLGANQEGQVFNINADTSVVAIARAMQADLLILSTKVGAIYRDIKIPSSRIAAITHNTAQQWIADGTITDGMIPKVEEALKLLDQGVDRIVIANASQTNGFLSVADYSQENKVGTRIVKE